MGWARVTAGLRGPREPVLAARLRQGAAAAGAVVPSAKTPRASNTPSLFASLRTKIEFVDGELTKRSPFGAYTIIRGPRSSA